MISLDLPWPPSVNGYFIPVRACGFVRLSLSPAGRAYRKDAMHAIRSVLGPPVTTLQSVRVDIELRPPDRRKRDIDNHIKAVFDAITHAKLWGDDGQVDELTVRRGRVKRGGMATVLITELDPTT